MKTTRREALLGLFAAVAAVALPKVALSRYVQPGVYSCQITQPQYDLLEDKYRDGLQQIMEAEDRIWLGLACKAQSMEATCHAL